MEKEQKFKQLGSKLVPIHKISATPASEPPKTFLEKVGYGIKYVIDRLYYYCFCAKQMVNESDEEKNLLPQMT